MLTGVLTGRQRRPLSLWWVSLWTAGVVTVLAGSAVVCGWPYWRVHPWWAALTVCCCAGLGVIGMLLRTESRTRMCGTILVLTGAVWSLTWAQSWNAGPLPIIGQYSQSCCFLLVGIAILQYIHPGRLGAPERWWIAAAVLVLLIGTTISIVISRPAWMGYHGDVFWPHFDVGYGDFAWFIHLYPRFFIALAAGYGLVLLRHATRHLPRKYRWLNGPLVLLITAGALASAWTEQGQTLTNFDVSLEVFGYQGLFGVLLVLALFSTGVVDRFTWLRVRDRLMVRASPPTMRGLRDAVARALDDPPLRIYYQVPDSGGYVDSDGRWAGSFDEAAWAGRGGDRWPCPVFADSGMLTAVIDVDPRLRERQGLVSAVTSVARLLLMHSGLQDEIKAAGQKLQRKSQLDLLQTGITERQRLERDLHDGAQQMLIALSMKMGAAAATISDPAAQEMVTEWRRNLRDATDELRNLARGIYPAALTEQGLRAAFESLAERQTELLVDLDIPDSRFPPVIETSLYFAVAEALTNAAKHARASKVHIQLEHEPPRLACTVTDDGTGMAVPRPGGGLEGIVNRIRVLGGNVCITAAPDKGSRIEMVLPCE